jgi:AcrR family transcriptional regulator
MITKPMTVRADPRAKRTRALLQQALGELLAEKTFSAVTIGDIAGRAAVNRATFYAHFQDKDDLLEQAIRQECRAVLCGALSGHPQPTQAAWRGLVAAVLDCFAQMPRHCPQAARQWDGIIANVMREELETVLDEWLAEARLAHAARVTVIAAVSGAIVALGVRRLRGKMEGDTEASAAELTTFIVNGLR